MDVYHPESAEFGDYLDLTDPATSDLWTKRAAGFARVDKRFSIAVHGPIMSVFRRTNGAFSIRFEDNSVVETNGPSGSFFGKIADVGGKIVDATVQATQWTTDQVSKAVEPVAQAVEWTGDQIRDGADALGQAYEWSLDVPVLGEVVATAAWGTGAAELAWLAGKAGDVIGVENNLDEHAESSVDEAAAGYAAGAAVGATIAGIPALEKAANAAGAAAVAATTDTPAAPPTSQTPTAPPAGPNPFLRLLRFAFPGVF